jgi:hypothetical protein
LNQRKNGCCFGHLEGTLFLIYLEEKGDYCQPVFVLESFVLAPIRFLEVNQVHLHREAETNSNDHTIKGKLCYKNTAQINATLEDLINTGCFTTLGHNCRRLIS